MARLLSRGTQVGFLRWLIVYRSLTASNRHIRPGGWIDQLEMSIQFSSDDGTVTDDHVLATWSKTFIEAGEKFGKTFRIADLAKGYMQEAGFDNVTERRFKLPVGPWSRDPKLKKLGRWNLVHCEQGIEGWAMALLTRVMGVSLIPSLGVSRACCGVPIC